MKELLQILLDRLKEVPGFESVEMFNNQPSRAVSNSKRTDDTVYPALFLQLSGPISYELDQADMSRGAVTVRVHVVTESPLQGEELDIYEKKDLVHRYFHRFTTGAFNPLVRTGEQLNSNHNNLYDYTIDYQTTFYEVTEPIEAGSEWALSGIQVDYDLNDDGDEIRIDTIN